MKIDTFFEKFDQLANAPNAVDALRELVLQLAVRGNLTEQANDESNQAQLARAEDFRIRQGRRDEPDTEDVPFSIPDNWGWVAVGDTMDMINGKAFKPEEWSAEGTPIIRIQNLNNESASFNRCNADLDPKIHVNDGDFLISWSGTPGTSFGAFIWNRGFAYLNQHIFRCELVKGIFVKEFLRLAVNARLDEMISHAQGAVGLRHITKGKLESIRLPLPPLAEQKRIVAKVVELMAMCDRLETQQQERDTRHAALSRASLTRFADAPTPANLDYLFHKSYAITPADLRKSILTLAVQGKLVVQDANDESASNLLSKIVKEKRQLVIERKIRQQIEPAPITENELPFDVPAGWAWARLSNITRRIHYGYTASAKAEIRDVRLLRITDIQDNRVDWPSVPGCEIAKGDVPQYQLESGDILVARTGGTVGKTYLVRDIPVVAVFASYLIRIQGSSFLFERYLKLFLESPTYWVQLEEGARGAAQPNVNGQTLGRMVVPIPPLAEQRRIVAKVDQLMALVDQLETQLANSRATAAKLMEAVVAELTAQGVEVAA